MRKRQVGSLPENRYVTAWPSRAGRKVTICGNRPMSSTSRISHMKYGMTPLNISDGLIRRALAVANTFMPMGGVRPAISATKHRAMTSA